MKDGKLTGEEKVSLGAFIIAILVIVFAIFGSFAGPRFVTPAMIKRTGLTDAQYELLWSKGAHPEVDPSACRSWVFHSSRGQNLEEWIGETMGEEDLGRKISETVTSNKTLVAENAWLERRHVDDTNELAVIRGAVGGLGHEIATLREANYLLEQKYAAAKPAAAITIRIQEALKAEGTLGPYLRIELVKMRDQTTDPKKREVFDSCIALMDSVVNEVRDSDM